MEQIAKAIGFVVFAVAKADRIVEEEEKKIVHKIINENWKILADKEDPFGVKALDFIDKMLVVLDEKHISSEEALQLFTEVYESERILFTDELKKFILDACIETGAVFNRMNKSELVLISRIENVLKS